MSSSKEIEDLKEIENLETVIERHGKVIEKLERDRINKIKELNELEATKKELEKLEIEKINETVANIPQKKLLYFLTYVFQLIKRKQKKKIVSEKFIRITEILKDVIIKKK